LAYALADVYRHVNDNRNENRTSDHGHNSITPLPAGSIGGCPPSCQDRRPGVYSLPL
jgi:hypothetical protein